MPDEHMTIADRAEREVQGLKALFTRKPLLALGVVLVIGFYVWHQFFRDDTKPVVKEVVVAAIGKLRYTYQYFNDGGQQQGYFEELNGSDWKEYTYEDERDLTYSFRRVQGEAGWITLYDQSRNYWVRIPAEPGTQGQWAQLRTGKERPWVNLHFVKKDG